MGLRNVPAIRVVPPYYAHPAYLDAMTAVIRDELAKLPEPPDHYVYSFHGIPQKYAQRGDPYATHVVRTTRGLQERLKFPKGKWSQTYQSLFGREEWLKPYTDATLAKLAKAGTKKVFVMLPGFTVDCLETIDEIGHESAELFKEAGGETLYRCPCLNDHPAWIQAMKVLIEDEGAGWLPGEKREWLVTAPETNAPSRTAVV
jgi:ferrochelatase